METEIYWRAVTHNDARFDGMFYLGVKTTGIYCKPSCRARLPKRENVDFFLSVDQAESKGFRACLRCRPRANADVDPQVEKVIQACELIRMNETVSLDELAATIECSPFHLQKSFKSMIGVSPKKYSEAIRMERFKNAIRNGSDVTTAMYDAGFGSSSRLYEKASAELGMPPGVYRKGGEGMAISYRITDCELGKVLVAQTPRGICSVTFGDTDEQLKAALTTEFPKAAIAEGSEDLKSAVDAILKYLAGENKRLVLPLDLQATAFQLQVWECLKKIPFGETRSYSQIAEEMGDKKKVRAVAQACGKNRVALVIPCHRVVASDGNLSGYRWGVERKRKLLANERRS